MLSTEIIVSFLILLSQVVKLISLVKLVNERNNSRFKLNVLQEIKCMEAEMVHKSSEKASKNPLCVFCLSPPFSIRAFTRPPEKSASRRFSVRCWRRGGSTVFSVRPRFKAVHRRSHNYLSKYISGFFGSRCRNTLSLQEVLEEIRKAWIPSQSAGKRTMDEKWNKAGAAESLSPVLLRRRLSAPETIMRKHMLAQQNSDCHDESGSKIYHYKSEIDGGSDTDLNRKREPDLMRKTSLLRRLWSHNKPFNNRFSGTFSDWQHSYGKLYSGRSVHSFTSIHSSPEHLVRSQSKRLLNEDFKTSPQHGRKMSPKHQHYEIKRHSRYNNIESETTTITTATSTTSSSTRTPKTTTETETSTRYTNTSYTTFSDNSDSAYTNSRSNFSESTNNNSSPSEFHKEIAEDTEVSNQDFNNSAIQLKNDNLNFVKYSSGSNEIATQTVGTTNVNVISNVQLSQSTLNLIVNQVMQDVNNQPSEKKIQTDNIVQVKQIPSFYLKRENSDNNSQNTQIVKCMISNIGVGSLYSKPPEVPQLAVPRYSARPHSSSMEVNMSSGECTDKESDTVSLVDSLEDTSSFRTDPTQSENIANKSDISLELPDNSNSKKNPIKPTAFFIPIETDNQNELKPVSYHLPEKVRNKLTKRQQKREEKIQNKSKQSSSRSDSNYISASENGNHIYLVDNGDVNLNRVQEFSRVKKRINKPLLPRIESFRKIKIDRIKEDDKKGVKSKPVKRKSVIKDNLSENFHASISKESQWMPKIKNKKEKLSPLYTSKNEYVYDYGPRKIYHKTEFNDSHKRIEILEIMECVDTVERQSNSKSKSKIPVLIHNKLPKINQKCKVTKPSFLDLDSIPTPDPKLDQLIANILIETLNLPETEVSSNNPQNEEDEAEQNVNDEKSENEGESEVPPTEKQTTAKYHQRFEVIPEELSFQSSTENNDACNNNEVKCKEEEKISYQGKAAIAVVKDENFSSIPKGWITFYMLHNNRGSPDSTSDEGKTLENDNKINNKEVDKAVETNRSINEEIDNKNDINSTYSNITYDVVRRDKCPYDSNGNCSSSSEVRTKTILPTQNGRYKKYNHQRKGKYKINEMEKVKQMGEWSVTVSGTNSYGQFAPDLEMCLKFPDSQKNYNCPSQSDSGLGEDNEQKTHFPKINTKQNPFKHSHGESEDTCNKQELPDIGRGKTTRKQRRSDSSIPPLSSRIEPRQTRTSTRRYNLSRPKIDYNKLETPRNAISIFNDSHYAEILKRFPEILSITGNAINQGKHK